MHCGVCRYGGYGQEKERVIEMSKRALERRSFLYANLMIYGNIKILYNVYRNLFNFI